MVSNHTQKCKAVPVAPVKISGVKHGVYTAGI
jgi:hypothetical protein